MSMTISLKTDFLYKFDGIDKVDLHFFTHLMCIVGNTVSNSFQMTAPHSDCTAVEQCSVIRSLLSEGGKPSEINFRMCP